MKRWRACLQGLGIATLFVPVSQLAYSNLPKNKNNKASSLTNLIPQSRRQLWHRFRHHAAGAPHAISSERAGGARHAFRSAIPATLGQPHRLFFRHGFSHADAVVHAQAQAFALLERQASFLAFLDCFTALGWFVLLGVPLVFLIRKFKPVTTSGGH